MSTNQLKLTNLVIFVNKTVI